MANRLGFLALDVKQFTLLISCASSTVAAYCAVKPPSITSSLPVMNEASSEARNRTPSATSMGWPYPPAECFFGGFRISCG